jgi:PAS domain-containing protein
MSALDKVKFENFHKYDNMKTGIAIINNEWEYLYINQYYSKLMQLNCDIIIGRTLFEEGRTGFLFYNVCQYVMNNRTPFKLETRYRIIADPGHWAHVQVLPVPEGILIKLKDIAIRTLN